MDEEIDELGSRTISAPAVQGSAPIGVITPAVQADRQDGRPNAIDAVPEQVLHQVYLWKRTSTTRGRDEEGCAGQVNHHPSSIIIG